MPHHHHEQTVPRGAILGAAALMVATMALAAHARYSTPEPAAEQATAVVELIELRFEDRADGSVGVLDAHSEREVEVVPPAEGGFIRGVMRGMYRTRKLESLSAHDHFRLMRLSDGALVLEDPSSGRRVDLRSFGDTNTEAFARILEAGAGGA